MINGLDLTYAQLQWYRDQGINPKFPNEAASPITRPPRIEGHREAIKETAKEEEKFGKRVEDLVEKSEKPLIRIKAIWPFDYFPDEVTVDATKVNIIRHALFAEKVQSIFVKDLINVEVNKGILFATLLVSNIQGPVYINYLGKEDAFCARRIIQGLIAVAKQDIDLSKVAKDSDFRRKVEILGEARGAE